MTVDRSRTGKSKQLQFCGELTTCLLSCPCRNGVQPQGNSTRRRQAHHVSSGSTARNLAAAERRWEGGRRLMNGRDVTGRVVHPTALIDARALNKPWKLRPTKRLFAYPCDWDPARKHTCHCATFQYFLDKFSKEKKLSGHEHVVKLPAKCRWLRVLSMLATKRSFLVCSKTTPKNSSVKEGCKGRPQDAST